MIAFTFALLIGLSLGLLGGGGSVLTVPVLVYVMKIDAKIAIAMSLALVGTTTLIGSINNFKQQTIDFKSAFIFIIFAFPGTLLGSYLSTKVSSNFQLSLFAIIMILAALFMFKNKPKVEQEIDRPKNLLMITSSFGVGILTGLIGVGGGFLIVPTLIYFSRLNMYRAVGTSIFIISINSLIGFLSYLNIVEIPWDILGQFILAASIGIIIGSKFARKVSEKILKNMFAIFLVAMGIFILVKNL